MYTAGAGQDWETIVVKKRLPVEASDAKRKASACVGAAVSGVTGSVAYKIEQAADGDGAKLPMVSAEDRKTIVEGRVAKKWTREKLAMQCNMDVKIIADIENGKAFENKANLAKIKRILA